MSGIPSPFKIDFVARWLAAAPLSVIDVGAAGAGVDPLWRRFESPAHVRYFSFEPNAEEFARFKPRPNTQFFPFAISDTKGEMEFFADATIGGLDYRSSVAAREQNRYKPVRVRVETLANLRAEGVLPAVNVVKTDTEGHDLKVLRGIGEYFGEVLCVKAEFSFVDGPAESCFADIDQLMRARGFMLAGLQLNLGVTREPRGGDAVYLRDVWSILEANSAQAGKVELIAKLICVAFFLRNLDFAYVVARAAADANVISADELRDITSAVETVVYLPSILPSWRPVFYLSHWLSMLGQLAAGGRSHTKSAAKDNRIDRYGPLFIPAGLPGVRARLRRDLDARYVGAKRLKKAQSPQ